MNKNTAIVIALVAVLGIGGLILISGDNRRELGDDVFVPQPSDEAVELTIEEPEVSENPEDIVTDFMDNFIKSAPPESDAEALNSALNLISDEAKMQMGDEPTSGDLAMFVGVQDLPDNGYQVTGVSFSEIMGEGTANIEVTLDYTGTEAVKTFNLIKIDNNWVIDNIN